MSTRDAWLAATWPLVAAALPASPTRVVEIGCGAQGGLVPRLLAEGYDAVGVDPEAPDGPAYHCVEFEQYDVGAPVHAVVACTSLHHVHDLDVALDKVAAALTPEGVVVILEWDWSRFDEATARWCFSRQPAPSSPSTPTSEEDHAHGADHSWLAHQRAEWTASGQPWPDYLKGWAAGEGLHPAAVVLNALDRRFDRALQERTPYLFAELDDTSWADEQAAIDAGDVKATGVYYVGRARRDFVT